MATIRDIARQAQVSPATVSQILNGNGHFSADTRERVLTLAQELGYRPNALTRSIRSRRTGIVGVALPSCAIPAYSLALNGIVHGCEAAGLHALLSAPYLTHEQEQHALQHISQMPLDALIYLPLDASRITAELHPFSNLPLICIYRRSTGNSYPCVYADAYRAGYLTTAYFLQKGRRHIAFMAGFFLPDSIGGINGFKALASSQQAGAYTTVDRYRGHLHALEEYHVNLESCPLVICHFNPDKLMDALDSLLRSHPETDAIIVPNDMCAMTAVKCLRARGVDCLHHLPIAGFDCLAASAHAAAPFLTVDVRMHELGLEAARLTVSAMAGNNIPNSVCMPVSLVTNGL